MTKNLYVVRLGGKLYIQSALYSLYQATTQDLARAYFYTDEIKAEKMARKIHGEVITLTLSDGDNEEMKALKEELEQTKAELNQLKKSFLKIMGQ